MADVTQKTELVARFANGNTGWIKVAVERQANLLRGHLAIWVQNTSGAKTTVNAVEVRGYLSVEGWQGLPTNRWDARITKSMSILDTAPPQTTNIYTSWTCANNGGNMYQWRAVCTNVRIKSGSEWCDWKTRITPTGYSYGVC